MSAKNTSLSDLVVTLSVCVSVDYELRRVLHLQPALQRHFHQLVPCQHSLHQLQQLKHQSSDEDVTLCKCCGQHVHDTCTVAKLADGHRQRHCDLSDDDHDDCVSPTWQRRSDLDVTNVSRTCDSVGKCQPSSSSSSSQSPASNDRRQILSSSAQNVLVSSVSSMNEDNHRITRS